MKSLRCKTIALQLILATAAMVIGSPAYAGLESEHGAAVSKACTGPVRACDTNLDCADDDECSVNVCSALTPTDRTTVRCTFTITNDDDFLDSISVVDAFDIIQTAGGPVQTDYTNGVDGVRILNTAGNSTCFDGASQSATGTLLPCVLSPPGGGQGPGAVQFIVDDYEPTMADLAFDANGGSPPPAGVLPDQATMVWIDRCDSAITSGCSPGTENAAPAPATTSVVSGCTESPLNCDDDTVCTTDSCDPATGCVNAPISCDDSDACTTDSCDPVTGCEYVDVVCDDENACTTDSCDPATGCETEAIVCDDDNACTTDSCDPATGCVYSRDVVCDDDDVCTEDSCEPATGCVYGTRDDCDDNDVCTTDSCDAVTGCDNAPGAQNCDDRDPCTEDSCDPVTGCENVPYPRETAPLGCFPEVAICRTPGFWGSHGGVEKNRSQNITQDVIDSVGGLNVCGVTIDNTGYYDNVSQADAEHSAIEAMCVSVNGATERQLVRQLTAAALNCVMSGGDSDCVGGPIEDLFADCNAACVGNLSDLSQNECIDQIDCFNNGGAWVGSSCVHNPGVCQSGGGFGSQDLCDADDPGSCNAIGESCQPDPGYANCHEAELCQLDEAGDPIENGLCFEPPGPAGSSGACNAARKNKVYVGDY